MIVAVTLAASFLLSCAVFCIWRWKNKSIIKWRLINPMFDFVIVWVILSLSLQRTSSVKKLKKKI